MTEDERAILITLRGETRRLTRRRDAFEEISDLCGGYARAEQLVAAGDLAAMTAIVAIGLGVDADQDKAIMGMVHDAGLAELQPKLIEYLKLLSHGRRRQPRRRPL